VTDKIDPLAGLDVPEEILKAARELGAQSGGAAPTLEELKARAGKPRLPEDPTPRPPDDGGLLDQL
jgi:hypothetical protein